MKNIKYKFTILLLLSCSTAIAQDGWLPNVHFNGNEFLCDTNSWKLVFQDDFNGDTLKAPWQKFKTYKGMWPKMIIGDKLE